MSSKIISNIKKELEEVISYFRKEISKVHVSRATPSLVEDLLIEYADQKMPLQQLASIGCPSPREIRIQPWSKEYIKPIEKAISESDLDLNPQSQEKIIYIKLPKLSEERRDQINKVISQKAEEARETVRHWWDEGWDRIKEKFNEDEITEDEKFKLKEKLQELIKEYREKINEIKENKQKEIKGE